MKTFIKSKVLVLKAVLILVIIFSQNSFASSFPTELKEKLTGIMQDSISRYNSPGMILGVWIPGKGEFVSTIGLADIENKKPMKPKLRYRIGSLTKTFVATVVLQLADEGKLSLDDTLSKYFPELPNAKKITVRQLLNMTSGLYNYTDFQWMLDKMIADRSIEWTPDELISPALQHKPYFKPGKGCHYSNTNYVLLGMIIEKITGNSYEAEVENRIIKKLKLKNTFFPKGMKLPGAHVNGYMDESGKLVDWTNENVSWAGAAGALASNLYDIRNYITAIGRGSLLTGQMQKLRMTDWIPMGKGHRVFYGLGIFKMAGYVGHNGGLPGYINIAMYDPANGAVVVFMLNTQPADEAASLKIFKEITDTLSPAQTPKSKEQ